MNSREIGVAVLIVIACLGLFFILICLTGDGSVDCSSFTVGGKEPEDSKAEEPIEEPVNWVALIFPADKEITEGPGEKVRPEPEIEEEPESVPEPEPEEPSPPAEESAEGKEAGLSDTSTSSTASGSSSPATGLSSKEQQMFNLLNEARKNAGLPALQHSSKLTDAARAKSKDMVERSYFGHLSPTYGDLSSLLRRFGISYRTAGENLAMNSNGSVSAAHNSLLGSPPHRANMLERNYSSVGIGIAVASDGCHYYTQIFTGN